MPKQEIIESINRLKPCQCIVIAESVMRQLPLYCIHGWTPLEELMGGIVGSVYSIVHSFNCVDGSYTFCRLEKPLEDGKQTYVPSDRRHLFRKINENLWERI